MSIIAASAVKANVARVRSGKAAAFLRQQRFQKTAHPVGKFPEQEEKEEEGEKE